MQAIILAAGMGRRLKELTRDKAKCMITINGVTLIERMLRQLDKLGLSRIIIVTGFQEDGLIGFISTLGIETEIVYRSNAVYDKTNNIYSLSLASEFLISEDSLLLESDLIFEDEVLHELLGDPRDTLAVVDKYESWMDGTVVRLSSNDDIMDIISGDELDFSGDDYFKTVNIYKFSRSFSASLYVPFLKAYLHALGNNEYYEQVLRVITILDKPVIKAKRLSGQLWYEIDNIQDMDIASSVFEDDEGKRYDLIRGRYGGYWRYPKLIDFCYLVNPFFPPKRMMSEIKYNFAQLMTSYPSGLRVNSLLMAKKFNVKPEYIVIGNGAAELIKSLTDRLTGKAGLICPTFEEYSNRLPQERIVSFVPDNADFSYSADDVMGYFTGKGIGTLVLINPDNPSGNYIAKDDAMRLLDWSAERGIRLIADESFIDFTDDYPFTLLDNDILEKYRNLIAVKSISKSYGVPGLRLGTMASSDTELIDEIKKDAVIWNINSFAEFYMQIEEKYSSDYEKSLILLKKAKKKLASDLGEAGMLLICPSQADFIMARVQGGMTAYELTRRLLTEHNILIKDLSSKPGFGGRQYVRIAVRAEKDNKKLIRALREIMG